MTLKKEDVYNLIPKEVLTEIFEEFELDIDGGVHGFGHWARVVDNGIEICKNNGANPNVAIGFGLFHDVKRENDNDDPDHGFRGGELLFEFKDRTNFTEEELFKIKEACTGHTGELHHDDLDVGTCWDSDRLDLYRVGIEPDVKYLNNEYSMNEDVIDRACDRAEMEYMSPWAIEIYDEIITPLLERKEEARIKALNEKFIKKSEEFFKDAYFLPIEQRKQEGKTEEKEDVYSDNIHYEYHRKGFEELILEEEDYTLIVGNYPEGCVFELRENELYHFEEEKRYNQGAEDPYLLISWACQKYDYEQRDYAHDVLALENKEPILRAMKKMSDKLVNEKNYQQDYKEKESLKINKKKKKIGFNK